MFEALKTSWLYEKDRTIVMQAIEGKKRTVIWYHNESIFYVDTCGFPRMLIIPLIGKVMAIHSWLPTSFQLI
jgi:hypothetical protein